MMNECGICRFAAPARGNDGTLSFSHKVCKRYPPVPLLLPAPPPHGANIQAMYPVVGSGDCCGEFASRADIVEIPGETRPATTQAKPD